jgi:hypothetical protein
MKCPVWRHESIGELEPLGACCVYIVAGRRISTRQDGTERVPGEVRWLDRADVGLDELPDFLFERHRVQQLLNKLLDVRLFSHGTRHGGPIRWVHITGCCGLRVCWPQRSEEYQYRYEQGAGRPRAAAPSEDRMPVHQSPQYVSADIATKSHWVGERKLRAECHGASLGGL